MADAADDRKRYSKLNLEFHSAIYRVARRPKLEKLIMELRESSAAYLRLYAAKSPNGRETQQEHEAIYEALRGARPQARGAGHDQAPAAHRRLRLPLARAGIGAA